MPLSTTKLRCSRTWIILEYPSSSMMAPWLTRVVKEFLSLSWST